MKRGHRRWHRAVWLALAPALLLFVLWALSSRVAPAAPAELPAAVVNTAAPVR